MIIVRHKLLNGALLALVVFVAVTSYSLFVVDPATLASPMIESIWVPVSALAWVMFSIALAGVIRARGRLLVGGEGWLAPYHARFPRPTRERVLVKDPQDLKLVVEPIRSQFATDRFKDWIELVVVDGQGAEVVRCFANPKWLVDDYQERFEEWKRKGSVQE